MVSNVGLVGIVWRNMNIDYEVIDYAESNKRRKKGQRTREMFLWRNFRTLLSRLWRDSQEKEDNKNID